MPSWVMRQSICRLTAVSGSECDTRNRADMIAGGGETGNAAQMRRKLIRSILPEFVCNDPNELQELYEKHNRNWSKSGIMTRSKRKRMILKCSFTGSVMSALWKKQGRHRNFRRWDRAGRAPGFVTAIITQHNILFSKPESALSILNVFSYQIQVSDLANYMRKMLEKTTGTPDLA